MTREDCRLHISPTRASRIDHMDKPKTDANSIDLSTLGKEVRSMGFWSCCRGHKKLQAARVDWLAPALTSYSILPWSVPGTNAATFVWNSLHQLFAPYSVAHKDKPRPKDSFPRPFCSLSSHQRMTMFYLSILTVPCVDGYRDL